MAVYEVQIKSVTNDKRGKYDGAKITGYNKTSAEGFSQFVFKGGKGKALYDKVMTLNMGDIVEFTTVQNGDYENIEDCRVITSGGSESAQVPSGAGGGAPKSGGNDRMSKAEWAAKDHKKELSISRTVALREAVSACTKERAKLTKKTADEIERLTLRFQAFLMTGDFEGIIDGPVLAPTSTEAPPTSQEQPPAPGDDDIPF